jgi:hypothetical protein
MTSSISTRSDLLDSLAKPPPPPSELDELMARDPLDMKAMDIDAIIAYQRQQRANREDKAKPKRSASEAGIKGAVDLVALVKGAVAPAPTPKPAAPSGGSFRRL